MKTSHFDETLVLLFHAKLAPYDFNFILGFCGSITVYFQPVSYHVIYYTVVMLAVPYSVANAMASSFVSKDKVVFDSGSALHDIIKLSYMCCNDFSYVEPQPIN